MTGKTAGTGDLARGQAVLQKNDVVTLRIEDMGADGEGIGRYEGMTFFVKDAVIGDEIEARVMKLKKSYGYARLLRVLTPSEYRVEPPCPIYRQCGGCQIQALSYEQQLVLKEKKVRNDLLRIGGFSEAELDAVFQPIVGMEHPYRYRNKAQFPVGTDKNGGIVTGFYAQRTHAVIPVDDCLLGAPENKQILSCIREWMQEYQILPYNETDGTGLVRHLLLRKAFSTGELMVCLVINAKKLPHQLALVEALSQIPGMTSVSYNCNMERTNVVLGKQVKCIWGRPFLTDRIYLRDAEDFTRTHQAVVYHISPQSFYQVNPEQTEKLYSTALSYAELTGRECVWDLYCGIGTISLFMAQQAKQVYGVELVPQAVADAKNNAAVNGIKNAEFFVGKAEEVLPAFYAQKDGNNRMRHPDVIVVDPPRKGCDAACLSTMLAMQPPRIVYVSCNPATLARDLRVLADGGYRLEKVRAFDQFPQTGHVETVCLLSKLHSSQHIDIDLDMSELDLTAAESKATYEEIKEYILEKHGMKVSSLYIAQIKHKCGLDVGKNYNLSKKENAKVPQCPPEKEKVIREALEHFQMI